MPVPTIPMATTAMDMVWDTMADMLDTTVILTTDTDTDMLVPMDTMVVTGGKLSERVCHIV